MPPSAPDLPGAATRFTSSNHIDGRTGWTTIDVASQSISRSDPSKRSGGERLPSGAPLHLDTWAETSRTGKHNAATSTATTR